MQIQQSSVRYFRFWYGFTYTRRYFRSRG